MNVSDILTHLCPKCLCLYTHLKLTNWTLELNMQTLNPRNWAFELPDCILKVLRFSMQDLSGAVCEPSIQSETQQKSYWQNKKLPIYCKCVTRFHCPNPRTK